MASSSSSSSTSDNATLLLKFAPFLCSSSFLRAKCYVLTGVGGLVGFSFFQGSISTESLNLEGSTRVRPRDERTTGGLVTGGGCAASGGASGASLHRSPKAAYRMLEAGTSPSISTGMNLSPLRLFLGRGSPPPRPRLRCP
ncbi:hypothetical protein Zm00014a_040116 [Zea mays]|uniref:Uncharacterized protein n=1 Tax=Zea mays TaxID=4577 RepID=A0A3L6G3S7_MAIZE|nr:hypothetical protein Zm00014a_040116 [Zea mays]